MIQKNQRITLKDIADECNCSVNTVSRALRNDKHLSAETTAKIQSTANRLGYVRNVLASSLRSGKSHIIAAIVDNIQNPYYSSIVGYLDLKLKEYGYSLMILCNQVSQELTVGSVGEELGQEIVDVAIAHAVDGIIFFPFVNSNHMAHHMIQNNIPFVQIGREIRGLNADIVRCDDYAGGYLAGKELTMLGHKKFLYIAGGENISSQTDRQKGFIDAISDNGIPQKNIRIITSEDMLRSILRKSVGELLSPIDYTAIFSFNDHMAYSVIHYLQSANYRIPDDISIIGFDNIHRDVPYALPLSSIGNPPDYDFVNSITELLLSRIEDPSLPARKVIFPVMLYDEGTHGFCKK